MHYSKINIYQVLNNKIVHTLEQIASGKKYSVFLKRQKPDLVKIIVKSKRLSYCKTKYIVLYLFSIIKVKI